MVHNSPKLTNQLAVASQGSCRYTWRDISLGLGIWSRILRQTFPAATYPFINKLKCCSHLRKFAKCSCNEIVCVILAMRLGSLVIRCDSINPSWYKPERPTTTPTEDFRCTSCSASLLMHPCTHSEHDFLLRLSREKWKSHREKRQNQRSWYPQKANTSCATSLERSA